MQEEARSDAGFFFARTICAYTRASIDGVVMW